MIQMVYGTEATEEDGTPVFHFSGYLKFRDESQRTEFEDSLGKLCLIIIKQEYIHDR
jgi:hypothetical protein